MFIGSFTWLLVSIKLLFQNKVIDSEVNRRKVRLAASARNDIWTYRDSPPAHWNTPLPEWFQEQNKNTYLEYKQALKDKLIKEEKESQAATKPVK